MLKPKFWNDERAIEFARVASGGAYGEFKGCNSLESKLERFKELKSNEDKMREAYAITRFADSFGLLLDIEIFNKWMIDNGYEEYLLEP